MLNATTALLEPLSAEETEELIATAWQQLDRAAARIRDAAEGTRCSSRRWLAMVAEGGSDVAVPPTIQALLAARLDQLDGRRTERARARRGRGPGVPPGRGAGARRRDGIVSAARASSARSSSGPTTRVRRRRRVRFRHILIRDAAYDALPKATRAELHERFADWLEQHGDPLVERDEILGYHLEQAYRYRAELGPVDDRGRRLGERAAARLAAGSRGARLRGDHAAAATLLTRAAELLLEGTPARIELDLERSGALFEAGQLKGLQALVSGCARAAAELADERLIARARLEELIVSTHLRPDAELDPAAYDQPIAVLERLGDEVSLAQGLAYRGRVDFYRGHSVRALADYERAVEIASRHGLRRDEREWKQWQAAAHYWGSTPLTEVRRFTDELTAEDARSGVAMSGLLMDAAILALTGEFDAARTLVAEGVPVARELGVVSAGMIGMAGGHVELLAGAPDAAVDLLRESWDRSGEIGETGFRSTVGPPRARAVPGGTHRRGPAGTRRDGIIRPGGGLRSAGAAPLRAGADPRRARAA